MKIKFENKETYSPLLFLAALGAWWTSVMFFMYLMFMTDHKETPIPTFNSILLNFTDWNLLMKSLIVFAITWIIFFAYKHFQLLYYNIAKINNFKKSKEFEEYKNWNKAVQLMAYPLTLAMSINVLFILGAIFIPNLWQIIEYLFPIALIAFWSIWIMAINIFSKYITKLFTTSKFDFSKNNNFGQMLAIFAFSMIWVWFAASVAMSSNITTVAIWLIGSIFFISISILFWIVKMILWFKSILKYWLNKEMSPTLWILIPILTLIWITYIRQSHWLHETFNMNITNISSLIFTTVIISLQLILGYIWLKVMKENWYFTDFLNWSKKSPWSYALICPGVALVVFSFFFIHKWLVLNWIIEKFDFAYFLILAPIFYLQIITIKTMFKLNKKFNI